jgi:hypothetical protein
MEMEDYIDVITYGINYHYHEDAVSCNLMGLLFRYVNS